MPNYLELPVGPDTPEVINAVIEIPLEGINKYEYDKELHVFRLDRNLYSPVHYPGDYGFIPSTLGDDGDPLDVLVLVDTPSFSGCVMEVRPIGLLEMTDQGLGDEKVLAVGKGNPRYKDVWNFSEIYPHILKEITHFFSIYKDLEGKRVEVRAGATLPLPAQRSSRRSSASSKRRPNKLWRTLLTLRPRRDLLIPSHNAASRCYIDRERSGLEESACTTTAPGRGCTQVKTADEPPQRNNVGTGEILPRNLTAHV